MGCTFYNHRYLILEISVLLVHINCHFFQKYNNMQTELRNSYSSLIILCTFSFVCYLGIFPSRQSKSTWNMRLYIACVFCRVSLIRKYIQKICGMFYYKMDDIQSYKKYMEHTILHEAIWVSVGPVSDIVMANLL